MTSSSQIAAPRVDAENIGGIDETSVDIQPGVNILAGRNATNRTSFLQALMAAIGSDRVSLKGDADTGTVHLKLDDTSFTRVLTREDGRITFSGEPYTEDATLADLFAFLLEDNAARRAVTTDGDLRDLIMRPVDTEALTDEISTLQAEKRDLDEELDRLEAKKQRLPDLEQERQTLQEELKAKEAALEAKRADLDALEADVGESREHTDELDAAMAALQEAQSDLEEVRFQLETTRESIHANTEERDALEAELADLEETPAGDFSELEAEISRLYNHRQSIESTVSQLQRIIQFNEQMLEGEQHEVHEALPTADADPAAVTDQLVTDSIVCWTCGSTVEQDAIEETIAHLRNLREEKAAERRELTTELDDLKAQKQAYEADQRERDRIERQLTSLNQEIEASEERLETLGAREADLTARIDDLEATVADLQADDHSEVLALHKTINQLEFERDRLEDDLASVEDQLDSITAAVERIDDRKRERETLTEQLNELRTRIERLEEEAVEAFNEHMATILEILGYENLDRVWLERTHQAVREGRRQGSNGTFDLHVVRRMADGTAYEDTIDHLSESEREVVGLVFALAGYLVHEVHEGVPFMLLDSLEAIDADRIAALVDYFKEYPDYLVVALLEEDAAALPDAYHRITSI